MLVNLEGVSPGLIYKCRNWDHDGAIKKFI